MNQLVATEGITTLDEAGLTGYEVHGTQIRVPHDTVVRKWRNVSDWKRVEQYETDGRP